MKNILKNIIIFPRTRYGLEVVFASILLLLVIAAIVGASYYGNASRRIDNNTQTPERTKSPAGAKATPIQQVTGGEPSGQTTATPSNSKTGATANASYTCVKTVIVPYVTTYENRNSIATGQSQSSNGGTDGFTYVCPSGGGKTTSTVFAPINKVVYIGTGQTAEQQAATLAEQQAVIAQQAARTALNARNDRISACIQSVRAQSGGQADSSFCYNIP